MEVGDQCVPAVREQEPDWPSRRSELQKAAAELALRNSPSSRGGQATHLGDVRVDPLPLAIAAVNASQEPDPECLRSELPALRDLENESLNVHVFSFTVNFFRDAAPAPGAPGAERRGPAA